MLKIIIKILKQIRELVLPMLEGPSSKYSNINFTQLSDLGKKYDREEAQIFFSLAKEQFEDEQKRRITVESKATTFLSATGLILALITSFGKTMIFDNISIIYQSLLMTIIFIILFTLTITYFSASIFYSLRALSRQKYAYLSPEEIINKKRMTKKNYQIKIALLYFEKTSFNYEQINKKVDSMVMAQLDFKLGVFWLILIILIFSIMKLISIQ